MLHSLVYRLCKFLAGSDMQVHVPMIYALRNPGMRDRHWKKLSDMLGFEVVCNPDFTAKQAIELGLTSQIAKCEEVRFLYIEWAVHCLFITLFLLTMPFHWYLFVVEASSCFIFLASKGQSSLRAQVVKTP